MKTTLPVGYNNFHKNNLLNFQLNRWYSSGILEYDEVVDAASQIESFKDFKNVFYKLGQIEKDKGDYLKAATYIRGSEFFALDNDTDKNELYRECMKLYITAYADEDINYEKIPYEKGFMPVMRLKTHPHRKGTVIVHGGYDSFMQELYPLVKLIRESGYDIILFEGPGQGGTLYDHNIYMTHEWEKPVSTLIDYYQLEEVSLIGISLGGYLAARAAVFDKRIANVVLFDIVYDYYNAIFSKASKLYGWLVKMALKSPKSIIWSIFARKIDKNLFAKWLVLQGYKVYGIDNLYDYYNTLKKYTTKEFSKDITGNVLLMAGSDDIYTIFFEEQKKALKNAHSVSGRIFTREEQASHHCQVGNLGLALNYIIEWLDSVH